MTTRRHVEDWTPQRIKSARNKTGMTQQQLAEALGVTNSAVGFWESGKTEPNASNRVGLTRILIDGEAVAPIDKRVSLLEEQLREMRKDLSHLQEMVALLAQR